MSQAYATSREAAGLRFYSGLIARPKVWNRDIRGQALDVFHVLQEVLQSDGLSLSDVVYITGYLCHPDDFQAYDQVWQDVFPTNPPARTTVAATILVDGPVVELSVTAKH